jgi:hypothetical protein
MANYNAPVLPECEIEYRSGHLFMNQLQGDSFMLAVRDYYITSGTARKRPNQ